MSPDDLVTALSANIDTRLAKQVVEEARSLEEAFLLRRWKYSELDGGRFSEVAARIVYSVDSGNVNLTKSVDDCLKYVENNQVGHAFPEPQTSIHLAKVLRAIYKLRSQRGAVHVSPTYTANEIDSRLIIEASRWVLAEIIRIFVTTDRNEVAKIVRELAQFPLPLIRQYGDVPLLQSVAFTAEEEILTHLLNASEGMTSAELIAAIPKDASGIRRALTKLKSGKYRQLVQVGERFKITDLGVRRIEQRILEEIV